MKHNDVEAMLEQAALSSKLSGWNDHLQWLVNTTLSRFEKRMLPDEALFYAAAGTRIPDPEDGKQKK